MPMYQGSLQAGDQTVWAAEFEATDRGAAWQVVCGEAHRHSGRWPLYGESALAAARGRERSSGHFHAAGSLPPNPYAGGAGEVTPEEFHAMRSAGVEDRG